MSNKKIALTGGIASGKSTIARMFEEEGAIVLDADRVAREVVQPGKPCWVKLRDLVGPSYFHPNGELNRRKLRERIIRDDSCRLEVNAALHPSILEEMEKQWQQWRLNDPDRIVIFDIPLLFELDLDSRFQVIILAYVTREIQVQRLISRDGLSHSEAERSLAMQLPIDSKRNRSHIVIENDRDLENTRSQVKVAWERLKQNPQLPGIELCLPR